MRTVRLGPNAIRPRPTYRSAGGSKTIFTRARLRAAPPVVRHAYAAPVKSPHKTAVVPFGSSSPVRTAKERMTIPVKLLSVFWLGELKKHQAAIFVETREHLERLCCRDALKKRTHLVGDNQ